MTRSTRFLLPMIRKALARLPGAMSQQKTVAVDLTPWPPPVCNGVDAASVQHWVRALAEVQSHWRWILLTSPASHAEFASLESPNVRRRCVTPSRPKLNVRLPLQPGRVNRLRRAWRNVLRRLGFPRPPAVISPDTLLRQVGADLLFCPLGATNVYDSTVPTVALWNDLTQLHYPQFLEPQEYLASDRALHEMLRVADALVCFSEHSRAEILRASRVKAARVAAIPRQPLRRLPHPPHTTFAAQLEQMLLPAGQYLLYAAPAQETSNHKMLMAAFGMFRTRQPRSDIRLVCATPLDRCQRELERAAGHMGLSGQVRFVQAENALQEAALLHGCRAVFFPCLEGTQAAWLLHALEFSKPIFCSDVGGLPESARAAARLFDARRPLDIVRALEQAAGDGPLLAHLAQRSYRQARLLGGPRDAAQALLEVFQAALGNARRFDEALKGLHPDGWTSERIVVTFGSAAGPRVLRLKLQAADWVPWTHQRVKLLHNRQPAGPVWKLKRGQMLLIERPLPREDGCWEFLIDPPLIPAALGLNDDDRILGCVCAECTIVASGGEVVLREPAVAA